MKVRNRKNGQVYETTRGEFQSLIVDKGLGHLYETLEDDIPIEVKSFKEIKELKNKQNADNGKRLN